VLALTRLKPTGNPKAWLIQVVDHLSMNYRRTWLRRASLAQKWGPRPEIEESQRKETDDLEY
jgi:DNA-directed RNA polymerase specialized sigma24 family protein